MKEELKNKEKIIHLRVESNSYKKLASEAKKSRRSIPNMAKYLLEKNLNDLDFSDKELLKMQSLGGIYSDIKDEEDIYTEDDITPIKWD